MKKIGNYIHHFIGRKVFVPENNKIGILTGVDIIPGQTDLIINVHYSDKDDDWDVFNDNTEEFDRVKPILIDLYKMSDDHRKELAMIRRNNYDGIHAFKELKHKHEYGFTFTYEYHNIAERCSFTSTDKIDYRYLSVDEIFYLMSKDIDVHGFLKSGQAVEPIEDKPNMKIS